MTIYFDDLGSVFAQQAEWRRRKAEEYPDDQRNLRAAEHLERLVGTVEDVNPELWRRMREVEERLNEQPVEFCDPLLNWENDLLREEGFHNFSETAEDFLRCWIDSAEREIADRQVRRIAERDRPGGSRRCPSRG